MFARPWYPQVSTPPKELADLEGWKWWNEQWHSQEEILKKNPGHVAVQVVTDDPFFTLTALGRCGHALCVTSPLQQFRPGDASHVTAFKDIPVAVSEKVEIWPLKHGQYFRENDEQKIHIDLFFKWMTYDEIWWNIMNDDEIWWTMMKYDEVGYSTFGPTQIQSISKSLQSVLRLLSWSDLKRPAMMPWSSKNLEAPQSSNEWRSV